MTIGAAAGASASSAAVSSAAACPSTVASFALRKNYVTLKQLQELRLKEQLEEEEKVRDSGFNIRGAEAARSSGDRPPRGLRRPAPLSISELSGGQGTADDSAPALAIGECAGGDGKRTWKGKDPAKYDVGKRAGPEDSSENPIPVKKEGNGRNRRATAQRKLAGVSGGEPEVEVLESEQASWDKTIPAKEGKSQNRRARPQPKLPGISGGASEVTAIESEEASSKNHIPATKEGERRNRRRVTAQRKLARVSGGRPEVAATESEGASSKNPVPMKKEGENQNWRRAPTQSKLAGVSGGGPELSTIESKEAPSKNPIPMKQAAEDQNRRRATAQPKLAGVSGGQPEVAANKSDELSSKNPIPIKKEREVRNLPLRQPNLAWVPYGRPEPSMQMQMQQQGFNGGEEAVAGTPIKASKPARGAGPAGLVWVRKTPIS